jgi:hypothetical protein
MNVPDWPWTKRTSDAPTRREAEYAFSDRAAGESLEVRPLDAVDRDRFRERWAVEVRAGLLVDPATAVEHADALIQDVMRTRGYPVDTFDSGTLSADQAELLRYFRAAHDVAEPRRAADVFAHGFVLSDDLRHALQQYRHLFDELVESQGAESLQD